MTSVIRWVGLAVAAWGCGDDLLPAGNDAGHDAEDTFTLVSRTPAPGADDVWLLDPIELVFSAPLEWATLNNETVRLTQAGRELAIDIAISEEDQARVVVAQQWPSA